jgi:periplasmic protein CpxP/Spy
MKRFVTALTLAALSAVFLALPAAAQDRPRIGMADRMERHGGGILRCLRGLDLTDSQKADIKAILEGGKTTIQADADAARAARQKLRADYDAGADRSVLGQDYVNVRTAAKKLQDDGAAIHDQVLAKLTPDQKAKADDCLAAHQRRGMSFRHLDN